MDKKQIAELEKQVESVLIALNRLIEEEQFPAYVRLSKSYEKVLKGLREGESISFLKKQIKWNCRMLSEAPLRNKEIGINLLSKMNEIHKRLFTTTIKE